MTKKELQNSLDLTNDELENFIPELLRGLWELGSMPAYIVELIDRNNIGKDKDVIDLGCGKGSVLVKIAKMFDIKAIGVDIVPEFIEEANNYAKMYGVSDKIIFEAEDISKTLNRISERDIVIYGYDSEVLGDLTTTLRQLAGVIKADGYIILEYMFADKFTEGIITDVEMKNFIELTGYRILDRIDWDNNILKQTNRQNTEIIRENVKRLISKFPDKQKIFNQYLQNQIEESEKLENDYTCTTLLLRQRRYCA